MDQEELNQIDQMLDEITDNYKTVRKLNRQSKYLSVAAFIMSVIALIIRLVMAQ